MPSFFFVFRNIFHPDTFNSIRTLLYRRKYVEKEESFGTCGYAWDYNAIDKLTWSDGGGD
ncbi:hypothetical protein GCM10010913_17370 [Paenibacillus aceti]|uniref:Uncharacterized protein n=1 Tax=Paenibacillus aceti TaxID=1820010 RepID=A0ABQ1VUV3_9BACL|nr:hypothetical protein GCM10010913_17370 [Paenibacillus aceti]